MRVSIELTRALIIPDEVWEDCQTQSLDHNFKAAPAKLGFADLRTRTEYCQLTSEKLFT